jgi:hypothetical protein
MAVPEIGTENQNSQPSFHRETVLQYPRRRHTNSEATLIPEEFVVEENVIFAKTCQSMRELMPMTKW